MSVLDRDTVDGMALDKDEKGIRLLIADHLDWSNEYQHLLLLQEKINAYIVFCESKQYNQVYKNILDEYIILEIHFRYEPTINTMNFLEQVQRQVEEIGIVIECHISEDK